MTTADELIANAKALLLDFDGPITALMPPPINAQAAEHARATLIGLDIPSEIAGSTDHLAVLRYAWAEQPKLYKAVENACTEAEVAAAQTSLPSTRIKGWIFDAARREVPIAVVSNNSEAAVRTFLDRFGWTKHFNALSCRDPADASLMKPNPHLISEAVRRLRSVPGDSVMVGDSVSDVQSALAANVLAVGVARDDRRATELTNAGAVSLVTQF
jgi:phosphoglycolate phosphatase-like HAD superfamily hydrolase